VKGDRILLDLQHQSMGLCNCKVCFSVRWKLNF